MLYDKFWIVMRWYSSINKSCCVIVCIHKKVGFCVFVFFVCVCFSFLFLVVVGEYWFAVDIYILFQVCQSILVNEDSKWHILISMINLCGVMWTRFNLVPWPRGTLLNIWHDRLESFGNLTIKDVLRHSLNASCFQNQKQKPYCSISSLQCAYR